MVQMHLTEYPITSMVNEMSSSKDPAPFNLPYPFFVAGWTQAEAGGCCLVKSNDPFCCSNIVFSTSNLEMLWYKEFDMDDHCIWSTAVLSYM